MPRKIGIIFHFELHTSDIFNMHIKIVYQYATFIELKTTLINQMNQSNHSQSDELITPKIVEMNNLCNEFKYFISVD